MIDRAVLYGKSSQTRERLVIQCGLKSYHLVLECQKRLASMVAAGFIPNVLLLVEHPHVFTVGRTSTQGQLVWGGEERAAKGVDLQEADRGGGVTYHGPGQLVAYPIFRLPKRPDAHRYLRNLEEVVIRTLTRLGIDGRRAPGLTGVWIGKRKIASIGVRFARGVARHGVSLNVFCDLSFFDGIIACGLDGFQQTSLAELGLRVTLEEVTAILAEEFDLVFEFDVNCKSGSTSETGRIRSAA